MPDDHIRQWGSPALHETAPLVEVFDDLLRAQARRLERHLVQANGAGLAATQVGSLRRMFAFRVDPFEAPSVLVNPQVVWRSEETEEFTEGCLSFNSVLVTVCRPAAVRVAGFDVDGHAVEYDAEGYAASLMQHEIDHLDGILTLHRAAPAERHRATMELLRQRRALTATLARQGLAAPAA